MGRKKRISLEYMFYIVEVSFLELRVVHTGDLHLGMKFTKASFDHIYAKQRRIELWETFERIIDRCKEIEAHLLLIAGDLFEEDYCTIGDIKRIGSKLKELENTKVIITAGNHDTLGKKSLYRLIKWPSNVYIFDSNVLSKLEFCDINTVVWGLSWDKKEEKRALIDHIRIEDNDKINILVIHGDILNSESQYLPISKEALSSSGFNYVALGHIHKPQTINSRIAYCGSPEPLDFGEIGVHGIIEGAISKERTDMTLKPFSKRMFIVKAIDIKEEMDYHSIEEAILTCGSEDMRRDNLYRITLQGQIDRDIKEQINDLTDTIKENFYYIEIIDNTSPNYDLEEIIRDNSNNLIGHFIREMKDKGLDNPIVKESLYYGLEALLSEKVKR